MSGSEVPRITPKAAWQLMQEDPRSLLVDIRSSMEFLFVGHPRGAIHIPWIDEPDWTVNPHFVPEVRKLLLGGVACDAGQGCAPILLICRSGKRSEEAGRLLLDAGLQRIFNVVGGFEGELNDAHQRSSISGWRFDGLPWEQC